MNSKPLFALAEVESDLRGGIAHYLTWRSDGREHVLGLYHETISWIEWNPDLFPKKLGRIQRAVLKRSFYIVYFIQEGLRSWTAVASRLRSGKSSTSENTAPHPPRDP